MLALACDDMVTSRLIEHRQRSEKGKEEEEDEKESEWTVREGPFDEEDFEQQDEEGEKRTWTVLVQEVDRHVPEVADLLQSFRFLPNWRVDDMYVYS